MQRILLLLIFIGFVFTGSAQSGGYHVYEFLNASPSARVTALGGQVLAVRDGDIALAYENPAILNVQTHQQLSFNYNFNVADIKNGAFAYGFRSKKLGVNLFGGIQFVNYGAFEETNEYEQILGTFKAREYAFTLGASKQLYEKLSVGSNVKFITSQFADYRSRGIAMDLGAYYQDTSANFSAALVVKNIGVQLSTYQDSNRESIPYEINIGIAQKLRYLPFRLTVNYRNLDDWNITYDDPNAKDDTPLFGGDDAVTEDSPLSKTVNNFFRHITFGGEFLFGKKENFRLRLGYKHLKRAELQVSNFRSLTGFSFGVGLKISKFRIDYGRAVNHIAGGMHHLTISTNIRQFKQ